MLEAYFWISFIFQFESQNVNKNLRLFFYMEVTGANFIIFKIISVAWQFQAPVVEPNVKNGWETLL